MNGIDPCYSRPLDVHRWSDYPKVKALAGRIWGVSARGGRWGTGRDQAEDAFQEAFEGGDPRPLRGPAG